MAAKKGATKGAAKKPSKHTPKAAVRRREARQELIGEASIAGNPTAAARAAGYSDKSAKYEASRALARPEVREYVERRREALRHAARVETEEIVGTLVSHMRGDFADLLPENEFLRQARERGVSHLVKKLKITERAIPAEVGEDGAVTTPQILETKYEIEIHDAQAAAKHLCGVFGLEKLPAPNPETLRRLDEAVDRFIQKAAARGIAVTPEKARAKLMPHLKSLAIN